MADLEPTDKELGNLDAAADRLWELDENRLTPHVDYGLNLQGGKKPWEVHDAAGAPLFKFVDKNKFFSKPTYKLFYDLLDNYDRNCGSTEVTEITTIDFEL
tara:strand:+ start:1218 stop:1520 length:303 start_codon:yes stop_codon:yes gene_type:complete